MFNWLIGEGRISKEVEAQVSADMDRILNMGKNRKSSTAHETSQDNTLPSQDDNNSNHDIFCSPKHSKEGETCVKNSKANATCSKNSKVTIKENLKYHKVNEISCCQNSQVMNHENRKSDVS